MARLSVVQEVNHLHVVNMNPLVSVIVASYNKGALIAETIRSVLNQSYAHWQLIVVDDCSTDDTASVLKDFRGDSRIEIIENETNRGANYCRNEGIGIARGEYILFLDADDLLMPACLEGRIEAAGKNKDANLLVFTMGVFYSKVGDDARKWLPVSKKPLQDFLAHHLPWSILQPLWKKDFLVKLNGFDPAFERLQDVELSTRALFHEQVSYRLFPSGPDCYYRIEETRKNFAPYNFLNRWADSALKYYSKFYLQAKSLRSEKYLLGTIYKTYLQILFQFKHQKIDQKEFELLENKLLDQETVTGLTYPKRLLFGAAKRFNLLPFRIPGLNWLVNRLMLL